MLAVRVRLRRDVDRGHEFIARAGLTGRLVELTDRQVSVQMDEPLAGAEEWNNCILWTHPEPGEVEADLEVLPSDIIVYTVNTRLDGQEQMVQVEFIGDYQRVMEVPPCGLSHKQWEQVRQQAAAARPGAAVAAFGQFYKVV